MKVVAQRFLDDLHALRRFGASGVGKGVSRPAFSAADVAARRWLAGRIADAGLSPRLDAVGNLFGLAPTGGLLLGSHSDSPPEGGWLDGAFGVIAALEVARASRAVGGPAVSVISFNDEEGRFGATLGSGVWTGALDRAEAEHYQDTNGIRLSDARQVFTADADVPKPSDFTGFIEPHIEQGPVLDTIGRKIGVVTAIVGFRELEVRLTGQQNHAGTTTMDLRQDAVQGMVQILSDLNRDLAAVAAPNTVWTTGRIDVAPNVGSIVPGACTFTIQWRDVDLARLDAMEKIIRATISSTAQSRDLALDITSQPRLPPVQMDAPLQDLLANAAEAVAPNLWQRMPSGAVHDAGYIARVLPAAMLFVPSIGGVSHDFAEDTDEADLCLGLEVLAEAVRRHGG